MPRERNDRDKDQADYEAKMKASEWKRNKFPKGLSKNLNGIASLMKENEEDYFFLISRLLQGYLPTSTNDYPTTLHLDRRKQNLQKIKTWFKYNKNVCDSGGIIPELSGRAPWMDVVLSEAKKYGGKKQGIIQYRVTLYHKEGASYNVGADAWCSSFACWCLENSSPKYNSPHSAGSRSFINHKTVVLSEVFFGAIAIFSDCSKDGIVESSGHVSFIYGKLADGRYAVLGGNQGGMIKVSPYDCSGNVFYSHYSSKRKREVYKKFIGFFKPVDFEIKNIDRLTESDNYSNADDANKKIGLGEVKTVLGEKDD